MKLMPKSSVNPHPIKTGKQVDERYCQGLPEPKFSNMRRPCRKPCIFNWKVSAWSKVRMVFNINIPLVPTNYGSVF